MAIKGTFKDISFLELLQLMHLSQKTGRIEVQHDGRWAMVIFRDGALWHVEPRGFHGASREDVIYELLTLTDGNFVLQRVQVLPSLERTVHLSVENIIMEGVRRIDDQRALTQEMGAPGDESCVQMDGILRYKPDGEARVRYVPANVKRLVQAIDGQRTIAELIAESQLDTDQAAQVIKELMHQQIVELVDTPLEAQPAS